MTQSWTPNTVLPKPVMDRVWGVSRSSLDLTADRLSGVFRISDGPVILLAAFMEITTAVSAHANTMSWIFDSDAGGDRVIGDGLNIISAALGDFIWAELDGTALIAATTSTGLIHGGYYRGNASGYGTILTAGEIDLVFAGNSSTTGVGTMYCMYEPMIDGASMQIGTLVAS
jgi:hypothetical protein